MHNLYRTLIAGWIVLIGALVPLTASAAPFAAFVMDARTGKEIYSQNGDARLHPASLTKMMTLYMAFTAIERGQVRLDSRFTITPHAAGQPPSRLGLRAGQKIELRYLIRAAAIKSANDAATAIGEGLAGSEAKFGQQMTAMARALGMNSTNFRNANGLTQEGHYSSARDMTLLGRRLFYDFPQYYNIFSRRSADAGIATVSSTNKRFLDNYEGADGIKTGYTRAAGFNLTASAQRGQKRIIATVLGGKSTAQRNEIMAQLLDAGFGSAPTRVNEIRPEPPAYMVERKRTVQVARAEPPPVQPVRLQKPQVAATAPAPRAPVPREVAQQQAVEAAVASAASAAPTVVAAARPVRRPERAPVQVAEAEAAAPASSAVAAIKAGRPIRAPGRDDGPQVAVRTPGSTVPAQETKVAVAPRHLAASDAPLPKSDTVILAAMEEEGDISEAAALEIVSRPSSRGSRNWGISLGLYRSRHEAEQLLLKTALQESAVLDDARRHVGDTKRGFEAAFVGMTRDAAQLTCDKLSARAQQCAVVGP